MTQYKSEYLAYLISPQTSLLKSSNRAFRFIYIGPPVEYKTIDEFQYIMMEIECKILNGILHFNRLKKAHSRTTK